MVFSFLLAQLLTVEALHLFHSILFYWLIVCSRICS